jgi:hypothetical protein
VANPARLLSWNDFSLQLRKDFQLVLLSRLTPFSGIAASLRQAYSFPSAPFISIMPQFERIGGVVFNSHPPQINFITPSHLFDKLDISKVNKTLHLI